MFYQKQVLFQAIVYTKFCVLFKQNLAEKLETGSSFLRIWAHLLEKSPMGKFILCAVSFFIFFVVLAQLFLCYEMLNFVVGSLSKDKIELRVEK